MRLQRERADNCIENRLITHHVPVNNAHSGGIRYLREMSFDAVKLDRTLLAAASEGRTGLCLLEGVLALCRAMGRLCVAEYIENDDQLQLLRRLGCNYGQGFGLCPPLSEPEADELIRSGVLRTGPVKNTGQALLRRAIG